MPRWRLPYNEGQWAIDAILLTNDPNYMCHSVRQSDWVPNTTHVDIEYRNPGPTDPRVVDYLAANGVRVPEVTSIDPVAPPRRVVVPEFEIHSGPTVNISDIRTRRFSLIDRYNSFQPVEESVKITLRRTRFARILSSINEAA